MSSIYNNIKNQSQNLNNYITINDDGTLSMPAITTSTLTCDTLNAQNENIQNNETVEGWSRATGEITAFYDTTPISMSGLKSVNDTQNTNISTLQGQMSTANTNISTLQGQMTTANTDISTLQDDMSSATNDLSSLNSKTQNIITYPANATGFQGSIVASKNGDSSTYISLDPNGTTLSGNPNLNVARSKGGYILTDNLQTNTLEGLSASFNTIALIDNSEVQLGVLDGTGSSKYILESDTLAVKAKSFVNSGMTTSQMNALSTPVAGQSVYNTDTNAVHVYNGSAWVQQAPQSAVSANTSNISTLQTTTTNQGSSISSLQSDVSTLQSDVSTLQSDVSSLQTDVSTLQTDVSTLQSDVSSAQSDITALETKTQSLSDNGTTLTITHPISASSNLVVGGNLTVNGSTITANSVINDYAYVNIVQNPADGVHPALTITQGGTSSGSILSVNDADNNSKLEINQGCDLAINTDKFTVQNSTGNTAIGGDLSVAGDLSLSGTTSQYVRGDGSLSTYTATGTMASLNVQNNKTIYMSSSGNDSQTGYSEQNAVLTLGQACTNAGNTGVQVAIFPSTYTLSGNVTLNNLNCSYTSCNAESGGIVNISGSYSVTISNSSSSLRFYGLSFSCPVTVSASGSVYFERCRFNTSLSLSGSGYYSFINCDLQGSSSTTTTSITGTGVKFLGSNCYVGLLTVNNASAVVAISGANNCLPITLQAGYLATGMNTPVYSATGTSNAITATGSSSILVLDDVTLLTPTATPARMSIGSGVVYSIRKAFYDKTNTTNSGTRSAQNLVTDGLDVNTLLLGGASFAQSGNNSLTLTTTGSTNVTLPTSGTLATTTQLGNYLPLAGGTMSGNLNVGTKASITQSNGSLVS